jgi:arylformamidase
MNQDEWLQLQYRPWTDFSFLDVWANMGASYLERANVVRDIPYGDLPGERLDLIRPSTGDAPVLIFIHGGYWFSLDKDDYAFALEPVVSAGALIASVNYTLCPEVTMDTLVQQVRNACAWIWRHVGEYGGDRDQLHVSGHSAGGHLSAMMLATDWPAFEEGLPKSIFKSAVPISMLSDLEPIRLSTLNVHLLMDTETAKRNSPLLLAPTVALPISMVVGGNETVEFHRHSRELAETWRGAASKIELIDVPGHDHFTMIAAMTAATGPACVKTGKSV